MDVSVHKLHRCFYALPFPPQVNRAVSGLIADLRRYDNGTVRWTPPQNLHLTLRFLGELSEQEFNDAQNSLRDLSFGSLHLKIGGIDGFPSRRNPSVLVLAVEGSTPEDHRKLLHLQHETEEIARRIGLEPEGRPFRPHITLGRVNRGRPVPAALRNALSDATPDSFGEIEGRIESLRLMESTLKPTGAEYRVAAERAASSER